MVVGEKGNDVYFASEESAIRLIEPELDRVFSPRGGEAVIYTLDRLPGEGASDRTAPDGRRAIVDKRDRTAPGAGARREGGEYHA